MGDYYHVRLILVSLVELILQIVYTQTLFFPDTKTGGGMTRFQTLMSRTDKPIKGEESGLVLASS